jgi:hypothetical protein
LARRLTTGYTGCGAAASDRPKRKDGNDDDGDQQRATSDPPADRRPLRRDLLIVGVGARSAAERLLACLAIRSGLLRVRIPGTVGLLPVPMAAVAG